MRVAPLVTVVIPARNEEDSIEGCIDAIGAQDLPLADVEVVVVDGGSADSTASVAEAALARHAFGVARVLVNLEGTTPSNLNAGLAVATAPHLCRVDARARIQPCYLRTCVGLLQARTEAAVVGGAQVAIPRDGSPRALGIARALNNRWAMGGSAYRSRGTSGPVDTVWLGASRTRDLRAVGGWDPRLHRNQDFDLNRRLGASATVWYDASLRTGYLGRASLRELWHQHLGFGAGKVRYWRVTGDRPRPRQLVLLVGFPVVGLTAVGAVVARPVLGAAALVCAAVLVEATGTTGPPAGAAGRLTAIAAMAVTATGWWTGVAGELLRRET